MILTKKAENAVRLIAHVRQNEDDGPVSIKEAAKQVGITVYNLEQLAARLRRGGVLVSQRGPGGGYTVADQYKKRISFSKILEVVSERMPISNVPALKSCFNEINKAFDNCHV